MGLVWVGEMAGLGLGWASGGVGLVWISGGAGLVWASREMGLGWVNEGKTSPLVCLGTFVYW